MQWLKLTLYLYCSLSNIGRSGSCTLVSIAPSPILDAVAQAHAYFASNAHSPILDTVAQAYFVSLLLTLQ